MSHTISRRTLLTGTAAGAVALGLNLSPAHAASVSFEWQSQHYDNFCSAAASRMMLSSHMGANTPSQEAIAKILGVEARNGADGLRIDLATFAQRLTNNYPGTYQATSGTSASTLASHVEWSINRGWPVVLSSNWRIVGTTPTESRSGHYLCITGYDTDAYAISCSARAINSKQVWVPRDKVNTWIRHGHIHCTSAPGGGGGTSPGAGAAGWTAISAGSTNWRTRTLQHLLKQRGYYTLNVDGSYGPKTVAAVTAFQRANGLTADGATGAQSWPRVIIEVRGGTNGEAARAAQVALNAYGAGLTVDGVFGSVSVAAAKRFQAAAGRTQDGVIGPRTWEWLI